MLDTNLPSDNTPLKGKLLVASTMIDDPILQRAVSLVVHEDDQHVFAVMLNRPMAPPPGLAQAIKSGSPDNVGKPAQAEGNRLPESNDAPPEMDAALVAKKTAEEAALSLGKIHFGGPLSGPVVAVHNASQFAEAEAGEGVYLAAQRELLESLVREKPSNFRLIVGHLGWTPEQLRLEQEAGYWHVLDANVDDVFTTDEFLWPRVIRRATSHSVARWIGVDEDSTAAEWN